LAHNELARLDVDPQTLRLAATEAIAGIRDSTPSSPGLESMEEVIRGAQSAAATLNHASVGTEHLLLGLLSLNAEASVVRFLVDSGVSANAVRSEIARFLDQYGVAQAPHLGDEWANGQPLASMRDELASLREARRAAVSEGRIDDATRLRDREKELLRQVSGLSDSG
jgi:ATP-dependent Clp protease ATP-binding subunit ClpA